MANIRSVDMMLLDKVFSMESGYVLDFSDRTMSVFYAEELNIDIDDPRYREEGTSKAKRTRCFLRKVGDAEAVRVLRALWEYRRMMYMRQNAADPLPEAESMYLSVIARLGGKSATVSSPSAAPSAMRTCGCLSIPPYTRSSARYIPTLCHPERSPPRRTESKDLQLPFVTSTLAVILRSGSNRSCHAERSEGSAVVLVTSAYAVIRPRRTLTPRSSS